LTTAAAGAGATLFGFLCGVVHAALKWDAGLILTWGERVAVAGLMAGLIVGICIAWDHVTSFAVSGDRGGDKGWEADWKQRGDWPPLPADISVRRHTPHEVNGRA
jgi:hypothetical protein